MFEKTTKSPNIDPDLENILLEIIQVPKYDKNRIKDTTILIYINLGQYFSPKRRPIWG
jgi:hypothetical protein